MSKEKLKKNLEKKGFQVAVINLASPNAPNPTENLDDVTTDYIPFGSNNLLPSELADRARKSSTHRSIINSEVTLTMGGGLTTTDTRTEEFMKSVNANNESLNSVMRKVQRDDWTFGNSYIEIVKINGQASGIFHKDASKMRVGKPTNGQVDKVFFSSEWRDISTAIATDDRRVLTFPLYPNFAKVKDFPGVRSIMHIKDYEPEFRFYGLPGYMAAFINGWIDIDFLIPKYNRTRFKNGFIPSAILEINGDISADEAQEMQQQLEDKFTGEDMNSRIFMIVKDGDGEKSNVTLLNDTSEGTFINLQELTARNIISAHRFPPRLAGIKTAGSLGDTKELRTEFEIYTNTVITDKREFILDPFKAILVNDFGLNVDDLGFKARTPFSFLGELDINKIVTINEAREQLGEDPIEDGRGDQFVDSNVDFNVSN